MPFPLTETGPQVLAIHGSASSGKQWRALQVRLQGQANVIAPDLPGYGAQSLNTLDRLELLTSQLLSCAEPSHLVAHSFGGAIAMKLANLWPSHVRSVTLYDPIVVSQDEQGRHRLPRSLERLWERLRGQEPHKVMQAFVTFWSGSNLWSNLSADQRDRLIAHYGGLRRDMAEVVVGLWTSPKPVFCGPVSILRGEHSPDVTKDMSAALIRDYPGAKLTVLPGFGHLSPLNEADAVAEALAERISPERLPLHVPAGVGHLSHPQIQGSSQ